MNTLTKTTVTPIFVPTPDWSDTGNFYAGVILRRHEYVIDCCANGSQRRGWWYEEARKRHAAKGQKVRHIDLSAPVDASLELPY